MRSHNLLCLLLLVAGTSPAFAAGDPRAVVVEEIRNEAPCFAVRVSVDHADRVYRGGETMQVNVVSEQDGYLYLFYCDAAEKISCLFPNRLQSNNFIRADQRVNVPAADSRFRLRIAAPFGNELLKAVVCREPLKELELESLTKGDVTPIDLSKAVRAVQVELADRPSTWAEHHVQITTLPPNQTRQRTRLRIGIFIGISDFESPRINDLTICHQDAQAMASAMREHGQLNEVIVLTDSKATREAIHGAIEQAVAKTAPGDEVFLFWSGHGGRCADDNGDEEDGYDEYLVPYDAQVGSLEEVRNSMLMDDTFGRWMQDLDGRKVVVILDTCFSGGQSAAAKGLGGGEIKAVQPLDFFDGEFERAKDVGQQETALLCSSKSDEVSFERQERDLSVMTYYLVQRLGSDEQLTLPGAFEYLKKEVSEYFERQNSERKQTTVLYDNTTPPVYLRP